MNPIVIGGLGGSGTRMLVEMLNSLNINFGNYATHSKDNKAFTFLLKRPNWYMGSTQKERVDRLKLLSKIIKQEPIRFADWRKIINLLSSQDKDSVEILGKKARLSFLKESIRKTRKNQFSFWGWKEPNSHFYLEDLLSVFSGLKYIHIIRDGYDMALSNNQNQARNWGNLFEIRSSKNNELNNLDFWLKANKRTLELMAMNPDQCLLVEYQSVCNKPEGEWKRITDFLDVQSNLKVNFHETVKASIEQGRGVKLKESLLDHPIYSEIEEFTSWYKEVLIHAN